MKKCEHSRSRGVGCTWPEGRPPSCPSVSGAVASPPPRVYGTSAAPPSSPTSSPSAAPSSPWPYNMVHTCQMFDTIIIIKCCVDMYACFDIFALLLII